MNEPQEHLTGDALIEAIAQALIEASEEMQLHPPAYWRNVAKKIVTWKKNYLLNADTIIVKKE